MFGERMKERLAALAAPLAIAAATLAFPPTGEFPIVDDWDYRDTVVDLLIDGRVRLSDWPAMTLLTHVVWGAAFAKVGGASYFTLRIANLTALALACVALFVVARRWGARRRTGALAALAFAFAAPGWAMANSFMTDVTAVALMFATALAAARCAAPPGRPAPGIGRWATLAAVSAVAYLCRQPAALPGFALAAVECRRQPRAALLAFAVPMTAVMGGHHVWLHFLHGLPEQAALPRLNLGMVLQPLEWARRVGNVGLALALFAAPVLFAAGLLPNRGRWPGWAAGAALGLGMAWATPRGMFHDENSALGIFLDAKTIGFEAVFDRAAPGPRGAERCCTALAVWALAAGGGLAWGRRRRMGAALADPWRRALALALAGYLGALALGMAAYDRYMLPPLALGLAMLAAAAGRRPSWAAWAALAATAALSVAGSRDYFERQRAWWRTANGLLARGVPAADINGSFEFSGVHRFAPVYRDRSGERSGPFLLAAPTGPRELILARVAPFSIVAPERRHSVSFAPLPGHEVLATNPFRGWLTGPGAAYALRRIAP